jgi:hypothetical protein
MARQTGLIFVEGIIGAGKSTTASFIARQLQRNGISAHYVFEGGHHHPIRLMGDLPRPFTPWLDLTPTEYRARVHSKWRVAVARMLESGTVAVFDGQLFHGNMTDLLLMDSSREELAAYIRETLMITAKLRPLLVYLRQDDLEQGIQRVVAERGPAWGQYQINWKLASPFAERRRLAGLDGLVALYREFRTISDEMVADLGIDVLRIESSAGDWPDYRRQILAFLGLPPAEDTDRSWLPGPPLPGYGPSE